MKNLLDGTQLTFEEIMTGGKLSNSGEIKDNKTLETCRLRFLNEKPLPFGKFPEIRYE